MNKYCPLCGKKTIKYELPGFDAETGERRFKMVCPDERCVAGCDNRGHLYEKKGFWDRVANKCIKCSRCGHEDWGGFY